MVGQPIEMSRSTSDIRTPPPGFGEHTLEVLIEAVYSSDFSRIIRPPIDPKLMEAQPEFPWHAGALEYQKRRDVLVDFRPRAGVRFSPHFYNTMEEIDRAITAVDEILAGMKVAVQV